MLARVPGQCAEGVVVTFAVKSLRIGEWGKGKKAKPGRADVCMLQWSLFLTEEAVALRARLECAENCASRNTTPLCHDRRTLALLGSR